MERPLSVTPIEKMAKEVAKLKSQGKTIGTVNGCFDILHPGHIAILQEARRQGDVVIVGMNSDRSVRRSKGRGRPILKEGERAQILLSLRYVDYVVVFDEPDPRKFLAKLKPHVHVNGAEYREECIEAGVVKRNGGKLVFVERVEGYSTTDIVKRMREGES